MVIYKIEIEGSDKLYIGSAVDFKKRKSHHLSELRGDRHRNKHLQRIYSKYGEHCLNFVILERVENKESLISLEQKWINKYEFSELINICPTAGNTLGRKHTKESREKISKNHADMSGENNPMYGKRGKLSPNFGRKHTKESKDKISSALKGRVSPTKGKERPEHSERMKGDKNPFHGKKHTEETKLKIKQKRKERMLKNGGQKLNLKLAREIRTRYIIEDITITKLAQQYGISRKYCGEVIRNIYWKEE